MRRLAPFLLILGLTAPAAAQIAGRPNDAPAPPRNLFFDDGRMPAPGPGRELRETRREIERARERGSITRREARALRREARLIGRLAERYGRDGLSGAEQRELSATTGALRSTATRPGTN